jgi:hypothetical protein
LIDQVDLLATFASLTGQSIASQDAPDSMNMLPAFLGTSSHGRDTLVEEAGALSLVEKDWKLIRGSKNPAYDENTKTELGNAPQPQLYDRKIDPSEKHDVAAQNPEQVQRMLAQLSRIESSGRSRP